MSNEKIGFPTMIGPRIPGTRKSETCGAVTENNSKNNNNSIWFVSFVVLLTLSMYSLWSVARLDHQFKVDQFDFKKRMLKLERNEKSSRKLILAISKSINKVAGQLQDDEKLSQPPDLTTETVQNRVIRGKRRKRDTLSSSPSSSSPQPLEEENEGEELQRTIHSFRREMFSLNDRYVPSTSFYV